MSNIEFIAKSGDTVKVGLYSDTQLVLYTKEQNSTQGIVIFLERNDILTLIRYLATKAEELK